MKKDAFYFSHDSNARNDLKMVKLRRKGGLTGVGLFWCIIEMLRESKGYELPIDDIEDICYELRCEKEIFEYLFECNLLSKNDDVFYSESLKRRMILRDDIREKRRNAGSKGGKATARARQKENFAVAKCSKERKGKERKGERKKEEKEKKITSSPEDSISPDSVGSALFFIKHLKDKKTEKLYNPDKLVEEIEKNNFAWKEDLKLNDTGTSENYLKIVSWYIDEISDETLTNWEKAYYTLTEQEIVDFVLRFKSWAYKNPDKRRNDLYQVISKTWLEAEHKKNLKRAG